MEKEVLNAQKHESLGLLAGGIAHDFNNILTAIVGNMQLAIMCSKEEDKIYKNLVNVEKAALRAKDLTQQLQTFSKGGVPVKRKTTIVDLIKETVGFSLKGSNILCKFSISADLHGVEIDEGQVSQVINNLVINAIQAMPKGGDIEVKAENITVDGVTNTITLEQGDYVDITVKDNGTGINTGHIENIFDPYFTTKEKGSGLGLASSYAIIKNHNGLITVDSKVGFGTTFHVYLPALLEKLTNERSEETPILVGKGSILIMDDEQMIRDV